MSAMALRNAKLVKEALTKVNAGDVFVSTSAANSFDGGSGVNTISYQSSATGVSVFLDNQSSFDGSVRDIFANMQNVLGSNFNDQIFGDRSANILFGYGGHDTIHGGGGSDSVFGGAGSDLITASATAGQKVVLNGGSESDTIKFTAAGGDAEIFTGTGIDNVHVTIGTERFHIEIQDFQPYFENGRGVITTFEAAQGDQLKFLFDQALVNEAGLAGNANALNILKQGHHQIVGDDLIWTFDNPFIDGEVVFTDIGQHLDINDFAFNLSFGFASSSSITPPV
jgi:Ca2+-binding RTX toxin-like protein